MHSYSPLSVSYNSYGSTGRPRVPGRNLNASGRNGQVLIHERHTVTTAFPDTVCTCLAKIQRAHTRGMETLQKHPPRLSDRHTLFTRGYVILGGCVGAVPGVLYAFINSSLYAYVGIGAACGASGALICGALTGLLYYKHQNIKVFLSGAFQKTWHLTHAARLCLEQALPDDTDETFPNALVCTGHIHTLQDPVFIGENTSPYSRAYVEMMIESGANMPALESRRHPQQLEIRSVRRSDIIPEDKLSAEQSEKIFKLKKAFKEWQKNPKKYDKHSFAELNPSQEDNQEGTPIPKASP